MLTDMLTYFPWMNPAGETILNLEIGQPDLKAGGIFSHKYQGAFWTCFLVLVDTGFISQLSVFQDGFLKKSLGKDMDWMGLERSVRCAN